MFLLMPLKAKMLAATLMALLAAGGTVAVAVNSPSGTDRAARAANRGADRVASQASASGELQVDGTTVIIDPVTGVRRLVDASGRTIESSDPSASASATNHTGSDRVGGSGSATIGSSNGSTTVGVGTVITVPSTGNLVPNIGDTDVPSATLPPLPPLGVPVPAAPVGDGLSAFDHGSYSVVVPGTPGVSKQLCLSGAVDRCRSVTVAPLAPTTVTVTYSSNISPQPPTFTLGQCAGGLSVGVAGLTPGATITVSAGTVERSAIVASKDTVQTASLCDA